jgi:Na+/proline symporter
MVTGFVCVPFFKFAVPKILVAMEQETLNGYLGALDVLLPSFVIAFTVAIVVSLLDKSGQSQLEGVEDDLRFAKTGQD